jgi:hypothetical protein
VSLNPRAIATLGVGFGATAIAYLGLWPIGAPVEPPAESARRPSGPAPFIVDYQPELPDVLLRLEAVEGADRAQIRLAVGPADAVAGLAFVEPSDSAGLEVEIEAATTLVMTEPPDALALAAAVDWSDDDEDVIELLMAITTNT